MVKFGQILAILTVVCALAAMVTGARLTSAGSGARMGAFGDAGGAGVSSAGSGVGAAVETTVKLWKGMHRGLSVLAALGAVGLAFLVTGRLRTWLIGAVLLAGVPGGMLEAHAFVRLAGLWHAVAASILLSVCAVAVLRLGRGWEGEVEMIADEGTPSLGGLARATWVALLLQTALGAMYRHQIVGLMAHVAGAMLVMGMVMYAGIAALSTENAPTALKRPALVLLIMTGVQMLIGLGAYLYRIEFQEQATGEAAMLTLTVIHVAVGAMTTACSALMGMQITRYVRPAVAAR